MPFRFPQDENGYRKVFILTDIDGLTEWVDYLPVQAVEEAAASANRAEADGYYEVNVLASSDGLLSGVDYVPVALVSAREDAWRTSADGFIPMLAKTGSLGASSTLRATDGWVLGRTYTDGGGAGLDIAAILDVVDNSGRQFTSMAFNEDGTVVFIAHNSSAGPAASFTLSTPYDLSTATQLGSTNSWGAWSFPYANMWLNQVDGSTLYIPASGNDRMWEMTLSVAGRLTTGDAGADSISDSQIASPDTADSTDGTFWFDAVNGVYAGCTFEIADSGRVSIGSMSTPFDMTTFTAGSHFNIDTEFPIVVSSLASGITVAADGLSIYIFDGSGVNADLHRWEMTVAYDCSTMTNHTETAYNTIYDLMCTTVDNSRLFFIDRTSTMEVYEYIPG